jgi:hypothetical protein
LGEVTTDMPYDYCPTVDVAFEANSGDAMITYTRTTNNSMFYRTIDKDTGTLSPEYVGGYYGPPSGIYLSGFKIERSSFTDQLYFIMISRRLDIGFGTWNGSEWANTGLYSAGYAWDQSERQFLPLAIVEYNLFPAVTPLTYGLSVANATKINRTDVVGGYAQWSDAFRNQLIPPAYLEHDGNGTQVNYTAEIITAYPNVTTTSANLETQTQTELSFNGSELIGESGNLSNGNFSWDIITFSNSYDNPPIVIATMVTQNDGSNNGPAVVISDINTTHANISICRDAGQTTCNTTFGNETLNYFVIDPDMLDQFDWIDAGTFTASTDGATSGATWSKTFTNTPYLYTTANSYDQTYGEMAATAWVTGVTTTGGSPVGCTHQGIGNDCDASNPAETFGYVALDPILTNI